MTVSHSADRSLRTGLFHILRHAADTVHRADMIFQFVMILARPCDKVAVTAGVYEILALDCNRAALCLKEDGLDPVSGHQGITCPAMVDDLHARLFAILLEDVLACLRIHTWSLGIHDHLHLLQTHVYFIGESPDDFCPFVIRRKSMSGKHRKHESASPKTAEERITLKQDCLYSVSGRTHSCCDACRTTSKHYDISFCHNRDFSCRLLEPAVRFQTKRCTFWRLLCHDFRHSHHCSAHSKHRRL